MKAEKTDRKEQVQELTKKLEDGITALFESDRYLEYLTIMARFHHYSYRNTLLILLQRPDATLVAGFHAWKQKFHRHVKKVRPGSVSWHQWRTNTRRKVRNRIRK